MGTTQMQTVRDGGALRHTGVPEPDRQRPEWENMAFSPTALQAIAARAIEIDAGRFHPDRAEAGGEILTKLHLNRGVSTEAIRKAIEEEQQRASILTIQRSAKADMLQRTGGRELSTAQIQELERFEHSVEKAMRLLPDAVRDSAKRGLPTVDNGSISDIPLALLTFREREFNEKLSKVYLFPVLGQLAFALDWLCRESKTAFSKPKASSAEHPKLKELFGLMRSYGVEPVLSYQHSRHRGVLSARFET